MCLRPISFLTTACVLLVFAAAAQGQILNGGFEEPDPDRATASYTPPLHWFFQDITEPGREFSNYNYVNLQTLLIKPSDMGDEVWLTKPFENEFFVVISSGEPHQDRDNYHSTIEQLVTLEPGDILCGAYFFGTTDYAPYNDTAFGKLIPTDIIVVSKPYLLLDTDPDTGDFYNLFGIPENDTIHPNIGIELFRISVRDVGDYQSTFGWRRFTYAYDGIESATFRLFFQVRDGTDKYLSSYLALDNIRICKFAPEYGDLNLDCTVNLDDFLVLSQAWMADCDPISSPFDPTVACKQADMNDDNLVNEWELFKIIDNWLLPELEPGE